MKPREPSTHTELVNAKTQFTVAGWRTFGNEVQDFLGEVKGQLEDVVLSFSKYSTAYSHKPAINEITLYSRLGPGLFLLVSDIAACLSIGRDITDSSGKLLALTLLSNRLTLCVSV